MSSNCRARSRIKELAHQSNFSNLVWQNFGGAYRQYIFRRVLLKIVENSILKMKNIIHELTDTRKLEYKYKAEEELLNIEHILEDVRLTMNDIIIESGAKIKSEINISQITFNRRKLRSVIYNLVNNGIKFKSPDRKPEIFIKTESDGNHIILSITDNGIGIEENMRDKIFSKYFRVENEIEGSGIGLY
jgi:two-component system phosphate regulon sensor histidine kinase PhoR